MVGTHQDSFLESEPDEYCYLCNFPVYSLDYTAEEAESDILTFLLKALILIVLKFHHL